MIDKIVASCEAAIADVHDGATVMIGGFGTAGLPNELTAALLAQGAKELVVVNNNAGNGDTGSGCVRRVYTDLAVLEITAAGIVVRERVEGLDFAARQACTGAPLVA
jgi:acyl CoA:acetate/3-ketoacid CoA transferase beta subunit